MEKKKLPKITAESVENFNEIIKKLEELPQRILNQIEVAEFGIGKAFINCEMKPIYSDVTLIFPKSVNNISQYDNNIIISSKDFVFIITGDYKDHKIGYTFINIDDNCKTLEIGEQSAEDIAIEFTTEKLKVPAGLLSEDYRIGFKEGIIKFIETYRKK